MPLTFTLIALCFLVTAFALIVARGQARQIEDLSAQVAALQAVNEDRFFSAQNGR